MNKPQDQCVKLVREWNRADNALGCRRLRADQATNELRRDRAESILAVAKPEGTRALTGAITFAQWQSLLSIGGRLRRGKHLLADVVAMRRVIAAGDCEPRAK
jgi:hypothetical protein